MGLFVGGLLAPGLAMVAMVNQLAPDFTLPSTMGKDITLSQFHGEKMVLLEFYGIDFGVT
jgi:peroxiredoxin